MSEPIAANDHEHHTTTIEITGNGQINAAFEDTEGTDVAPIMRTSPPPPSHIQRPNTPPPQVPRPNTPPPQIPTAQQDSTHMNGDTPHLNGEAKTNGIELKTPGSENAKEVTEAVNLELVNIQPYSNSIPIKKESTELDIGDPYDEYFVPVNQHKKYMRGEKLYVTQDKRRSLGGSNKKCCWGVLTVIVLGGIVAILIGVILSSQDSVPLEESRNFNGMRAMIGGGIIPTPSPSSTPQPPRPTTDMSEMYLSNVLQGELTIDNLEFTPGLADHNSSEFKNLAASLEEELKSALFDHQTLHYGSADITVKVLEFRPGSVIVVYRVGWEFKENIKNPPDPVDKDGLKSKLQEHLRANEGFLYNYRLTLHNLKSERVMNICKIENGGCSHNCMFDRNILKIICVCQEPDILSDDGKTCVSAENNKSEEIPVTSSPEQVPYNDDVETSSTNYMQPSETEKPRGLDNEKIFKPVNEINSSSEFIEPYLSTSVSTDPPIEDDHLAMSHPSMETESVSSEKHDHSNMEHSSLESEVPNKTELPLVTEHIEMNHSSMDYENIPPHTELPTVAENTGIREKSEESEIPSQTHLPLEDMKPEMNHSSLEYEIPIPTESHPGPKNFGLGKDSNESEFTSQTSLLFEDEESTTKQAIYSQIPYEMEQPKKREHSQIGQSSKELETMSETEFPPKEYSEMHYSKEHIFSTQTESSQENDQTTMHNLSDESILSSEENSKIKHQPENSISEINENVNLQSVGSSNVTESYNASSETWSADNIGVTRIQSSTEVISPMETIDPLMDTNSSLQPISGPVSSQINISKLPFNDFPPTTPSFNSQELHTTINFNVTSETTLSPSLDFHQNSTEIPEKNYFTNEFASSEASKIMPSTSSERLAKNNQFSYDSAEFKEAFMGTTDYEVLTDKTENAGEGHTIPSSSEYMNQSPSGVTHEPHSLSVTTISLERDEEASTEKVFSGTSETITKENLINNTNDKSMISSLTNYPDNKKTEDITNKPFRTPEVEGQLSGNSGMRSAIEKDELNSMTTTIIPMNQTLETAQHPYIGSDNVSFNSNLYPTVLPSFDNDTYDSHNSETTKNSQNISDSSTELPEMFLRDANHTEHAKIAPIITSSFDPINNISSTETQISSNTSTIEETDITTEKIPEEANTLVNVGNFSSVDTNKAETAIPTTELINSSTDQSRKVGIYEEKNTDGMHPSTFLVEGENMPSIALTPNPDLSGPYSVDSTIQPVTEEDDIEEIKSTISFNSKMSSDNAHDHSNLWYDSKNALNSLDDDYHEEDKYANYKSVKGKPEHLGKEYKNIKIEETLRVPLDNDAVEQMHAHRIEQVPTTPPMETNISSKSIVNAESSESITLPPQVTTGSSEIKEEEKLLIKEIYTEQTNTNIESVSSSEMPSTNSGAKISEIPETSNSSTEPALTINPQAKLLNEENNNEMIKLNYAPEITTLSSIKEEIGNTYVPEVTLTPINISNDTVNGTEYSNSVQKPSNLNGTVTSEDSKMTVGMETAEAVTLPIEVGKTHVNLSDIVINNITTTTSAPLEVVQNNDGNQSLINLNENIANGGLELSMTPSVGGVLSSTEKVMRSNNENPHNLNGSALNEGHELLYNSSSEATEIGSDVSKMNNTENPTINTTLHPFENSSVISFNISSNHSQGSSTKDISEVKSENLDSPITTTMEFATLSSNSAPKVTESLPGLTESLFNKAEPSSTVSP